jgi:hypothetical protein
MHTLLQSRINFLLAVFFVFSATVIGVVIGIREASKREPVQEYTVVLESSEQKPTELQYGVWPALAQEDFFSSVRDGFIRENASFVEANLTAMTMRVYQDGTPVLEVPIKSKGKEGSWWETPSGLYKAEVKEERHFSSFGNVYTPWNIPFQGNFFIHGWPFYEDGTPVSEGYSGGCIRLEDIYARQVYDLVDVGTPILVYEDSTSTDSFSYMLKSPQVHAKSYLVADVDTNFVLLAGETQSTHDTSFLPKLMTALVASEYKNIEKVIPIDERVLGGVAPERLTVGQRYSIYDLFFPLLLEGSAESAQVIASLFPNDRLLELLDTKAKAIGMGSTVFTDPAGITPGNTTTALDVFQFLKYLHSNRPFILAMSAGTADTRAYGESAFTDIEPSHPLADMEGFEGGALDLPPPKLVSAENMSAAMALVFASSSVATSAHSPSDLVTLFTIPFNGAERHVAVIVLDSPNPVIDTRTLRAYASWLFE